jgi:hypothetical protein
MTAVTRFRRQAEKCATLANRTHDEDSRQRFRQLEQTYLHLAESEEQHPGQLSTLTEASEPKRPEPP